MSTITLTVTVNNPPADLDESKIAALVRVCLNRGGVLCDEDANDDFLSANDRAVARHAADLDLKVEALPNKLTNGYWEVTVDRIKQRGSYEHTENGKGGTLLFDGPALVDYDGMSILPSKVKGALETLGFTVGEEF